MKNKQDLVDVSGLARTCGFSRAFAVRITKSVHELCSPSESSLYESYTGRVCDVLIRAKEAVNASRDTIKRGGVEPYRVKVGGAMVDLCAYVDITSGPAFHIARILPAEK